MVMANIDFDKVHVHKCGGGGGGGGGGLEGEERVISGARDKKKRYKAKRGIMSKDGEGRQREGEGEGGMGVS